AGAPEELPPEARGPTPEALNRPALNLARLGHRLYGLRPAFGGPLVLLQLVLDLAHADAGHVGGLARGAARALEGLEDGVALDLLERGAGDLDPDLRVPGRHLGGQLGRRDPGAVRQHHRPLDHVLELAHVAGPGVAGQPGQRLVAETVD